MKTTLEIVDILWTKLDGSSLKTAISGSISKHTRDHDSSKEDIVINCLPAPNDQLQKVIANVNIHVPDIKVSQNGVQSSHPNHARLKVLADSAISILKDNWTSVYHFDIQQQVLVQDQEAGDHYLNIRIEFFNENL